MSRLKRNIPLFAVSCAAMCASLSTFAAQPDPAQAYPERSVRFIVPFEPGAGTDITARTIAAKLSDRWKQQVIADNRTGGAGAVGLETTKNAVPDGYTICLISASSSVNSAVNTKLPYDLTRDLQGITQATSLFYALYLHPSVPATNIKELVAYTKANPRKLNYGSSGTGGLQHLSGELFDYLAGTRLTHVPYKGSAPALIAAIANETQLGFGTLLGLRQYMQSGRLRVLGITAAKRSAAAPELPTIAEAGVPGYAVDQWYGVITGAKVPASIVSKINNAIIESLKAPDVVQRLTSDGSTPIGSTPEQFNVHIKGEISKWRKLAADAKLTLQ